MTTVQSQIITTYKAAVSLRNSTDEQVMNALQLLADALEASAGTLLEANRQDVAKVDPANPRLDRLLLNEQRLKGIANSIRQISRLPNPTGKVLEQRTLYNGLQLQKVTVPLGVVGAIYESRPNVTFDIAALCLRSMNACVLKGSSEAEHTNRAAIALIHKVLEAAGINPDCVTLLPPARETVQELFTATRYVDVLIPRGSEGLIQFVRKNSLVPVIETGAGVVHIYVEKDAALEKAVDIVVNAKVSRPSVCNAVDTVLVDDAIAPRFLEQLQERFRQHNVEIFADHSAAELLQGYPHLQQATTEDFGREFLDLKCAVKVVRNIDEALEHIQEFSTRHSEAIVSENKEACNRFIREVDAAAVYANASTRFTDGEEFGLGAEIGISTQKLHARGPFALEKLVTEKWIIQGEGQIR
ncbi:glutamate-5-semialdehyde dehydrogenase [Paraflavisolibacter sp. H34]|uniref:glutamate-5-semialdehyde dehydrogenase n=1 Tax=Huijunlia imazamoxiresistens TaxID=3127457 RepID=UPI00301812C2